MTYISVSSWSGLISFVYLQLSSDVVQQWTFHILTQRSILCRAFSIKDRSPSQKCMSALSLNPFNLIVNIYFLLIGIVPATPLKLTNLCIYKQLFKCYYYEVTTIGWHISIAIGTTNQPNLRLFTSTNKKSTAELRFIYNLNVSTIIINNLLSISLIFIIINHYLSLWSLV